MPAEMQEAESRRIYAERTGMPKGYLEDHLKAKGAEDINIEMANELFTPIKENPLDVAVTRYLQIGDFNEMVKLLPRVDQLKLDALGTTVLGNIDELNSTIEGMEVEIVRVETELAQGDLSKKAIKEAYDNISILNADKRRMLTMIKELRGGRKFNIDDAASLGIALRETEGGNIVPALRKSGFYATEEFAQSEYLRDVNYALSQIDDVNSMFENMDGGEIARLSDDGRAVAQKYILYPANHSMMAMLDRFLPYYYNQIHTNLSRFNLRGKQKDFVDVIEQVSSQEADFKTADLLRLPEIQRIISKYNAKEQSNMVEGAQWVRAFLDDMIAKQNAVREARNQDLIPFRRNYLPQVIERNLWNRLGIGNILPADLFRKPPMPDFIKPNAPFNPREQARKNGLAGYILETNVEKLLFDYTFTAAKDIFFTGIIQNTKIHTAMMRARGMVNSSRLIEDWGTEAFAGSTSHITRGIEAATPRKGLKGLFAIRRNLTRAVFPFNIKWNLSIQPTSIAFTFARAGLRASVNATDIFFSHKARVQARSTFSLYSPG